MWIFGLGIVEVGQRFFDKISWGEVFGYVMWCDKGGVWFLPQNVWQHVDSSLVIYNVIEESCKSHGFVWWVGACGYFWRSLESIFPCLWSCLQCLSTSYLTTYSLWSAMHELSLLLANISVTWYKFTSTNLKATTSPQKRHFLELQHN